MSTGQKKFEWQRSLRVKLLIIFLSSVLIMLMFPKEEALESEVTVGSIWIGDDLIAGMAFPINKNPALYQHEKQNAVNAVFPVFYADNGAVKRSSDSIESYNQFITSLIDNDLALNLDRQQRTFLSTNSYKFLKNLRKNPANRLYIQALDFARHVVARLSASQILSLNLGEISKDSICIRNSKFDYVRLKNDFKDINSLRAEAESIIKAKYENDPQLAEVLNEYIPWFIFPNLIYSKAFTEEEKQHAANKVSQNIGIVNENERIVGKHERVTEDVKLKIDSYRRAKAEKSGIFDRSAQFVGNFLHSSIIFFLFFIYLFLFRKKIFSENTKVLLICLLILFVSCLTFLLSQININAPLYLLVILPAASMLLTILFDSRVGFYGTVTTSLLIGGLRGNDYTFTVMNILAGAIAAYTVRGIKNRTQIFRSFLFIFLGYTVAILIFGLERFASFNNIAEELAYAASNAFLSPVFTFGMIIFFEKIFGITTDLTLLELTDFDRPLLRELARTAQGTFSHSITVGAMAEQAAEAIGANPLMARVGAYYHDIGKTLNPANFVENQMSSENRHELITPKESAELIIDHVKRGIILAKDNKLPKEIVDFIPLHHGTLLVGYFYEKAKTLYGEENVNPEDYRYPGPKPNTKETALLMLADACESTVRAIKEPDKVKVENVINNIVKNRIEDGQLDDCPLTISDIKKTKEEFLNFLIGQYHKRIRYPMQDELEQG
jgi:putative nucleotidyltransferase with HDIG domain